MKTYDIIRALRICARKECPPNCPRYPLPEEGYECAPHLLELAADVLERYASVEEGEDSNDKT